MSNDPRITRDQIEIVPDFTRDGETYRAACVGDMALTGPEHADLSDDELLAEAVTEARRANIFIGPAKPTMHDRATYTATWDDDGRVIYKSEAPGNRFGHLPLGSMPSRFPGPDAEDEWNGAQFECDGRVITVRRDG